jgi:hypothetical protein
MEREPQNYSGCEELYEVQTFVSLKEALSQGNNPKNKANGRGNELRIHSPVPIH